MYFNRATIRSCCSTASQITLLHQPLAESFSATDCCQRPGSGSNLQSVQSIADLGSDLLGSHCLDTSPSEQPQDLLASGRPSSRVVAIFAIESTRETGDAAASDSSNGPPTGAARPDGESSCSLRFVAIRPMFGSISSRRRPPIGP